MAEIVRKPPSPSDNQDPRAREYFDGDLYRQHALVGTRTYDLPSIGPGNQAAFTITVNGAKADKQQTVEYGLPSNWNTGLIVGAAYVSADNTVTLVITNPTAGSLNQASATYSVRVRP